MCQNVSLSLPLKWYKVKQMKDMAEKKTYARTHMHTGKHTLTESHQPDLLVKHRLQKWRHYKHSMPKWIDSLALLSLRVDCSHTHRAMTKKKTHKEKNQTVESLLCSEITSTLTSIRKELKSGSSKITSSLVQPVCTGGCQGPKVTSMWTPWLSLTSSSSRWPSSPRSPGACTSPISTERVIVWTKNKDTHIITNWTKT